MAIGLGFDSVNSEFNRRTLSRVLSQPLYRDALLLGQVPGRPRHARRGAGGAVADRARCRPAAARPAAARRRGGARPRLPGRGHRLWRRVAGGGDAVLGDLPLDRDLGALRARAVAVLPHPLADDRVGDRRRLRAGADHVGRPVCRDRGARSRPSSGCRPTPCSARRSWACSIPRHARSGFMLPMQMRGAIPGAPLPLDQSLLLIWPQITGLDRRHDRGVRGGLHRLPARGSQGLKDWTEPAALNNARWCDAVCRAHGRPGTLPAACLGQRRAGAALLSQRGDAGARRGRTRRAAQHDRHPRRSRTCRAAGR